MHARLKLRAPPEMRPMPIMCAMPKTPLTCETRAKALNARNALTCMQCAQLLRLKTPHPNTGKHRDSRVSIDVLNGEEQGGSNVIQTGNMNSL